MELTKIHGIFHSNTEHTAAHGSFSKQTTSWYTKQIFMNQKVRNHSFMLSHHNTIKIKINSKQICSKYTNS